MNHEIYIQVIFVYAIGCRIWQYDRQKRDSRYTTGDQVLNIIKQKAI